MTKIIKNGLQYNVDPSAVNAKELLVTTPEVEVVSSAQPYQQKQLQYALAHAYSPTQEERIQDNKRNANIASNYFNSNPSIGNLAKGAWYWLKSKPYFLGQSEDKNNYITGIAPLPSSKPNLENIKVGTFKFIRKSPKFTEATVRGQILKPSEVTPDLFDFKNNWYYAHGTNPEAMRAIQKTGLRGSLWGLSNQIPMLNYEAVQDWLHKAEIGQGLHHNAQAISFVRFPKLKGQVRRPDDFFDYLTPAEEIKYLPNQQTPPRFSFFGVDATLK